MYHGYAFTQAYGLVRLTWSVQQAGALCWLKELHERDAHGQVSTKTRVNIQVPTLTDAKCAEAHGQVTNTHVCAKAAQT